jgi:2-polyprenyl-3-methyl-5-hydroxy-6-metoxy-1,4-benzoquinol methylase
MTTEDEQFALKFEIEALADLTIHGKAERWVPGFIWPLNEREHLSRYNLASAHVQGKTVLDLASGSGYGSFLLATEGKASEVVACDLDQSAIRYGNARYSHPRVKRFVENAEEFQRPDYFDVVVSFETIEHLQNYQKFLQNVRTSLVNNGKLIISTPIVANTRTNCRNPYHKIEWSFQDFQMLIREFFVIEETYVQSLQFALPTRNIAQRISDKVARVISNEQNQLPLINPLPEKLLHPEPKRTIVDGYQIIICRKN